MSKSQSPKRTQSGPRVAKDADDALLDQLQKSNEISLPYNQLLAVGVITAFLPAYIAHSFFSLDWTHVFHVPLYVAVCGGTAFLLAHAYDQFAKTEYIKRMKHYQEVKSENDQKLLKDLRLQVSMGYAMTLVNGVFFIAVSVLQLYVLRTTNAYLSFIIAPLLVGGILWVWAEKNLDIRKKKSAGIVSSK